MPKSDFATHIFCRSSSIPWERQFERCPELTLTVPWLSLLNETFDSMRYDVLWEAPKYSLFSINALSNESTGVLVYLVLSDPLQSDPA